jgi:hypothetical protein
MYSLGQRGILKKSFDAIDSPRVISCFAKPLESVRKDHSASSGICEAKRGEKAMSVPAKMACSFCGTQATEETWQTHYVAGPKVFVCRDCVGMRIDIFSENDHQWADKKARDIAEVRSKPERKR